MLGDLVEANTDITAASREEVGAIWGETMGLPAGDTKEGALRAVTALLESERVPYALIGGVAVQILTEEPRTTRDIDIALRTFADIPNAALIRAGFEHLGRHAHSDKLGRTGPRPSAGANTCPVRSR